jgi:tetratricopeptide (TPR) repeat protein
VPRDLAAIVRKAMAHAPPARYPSARELAADLRRFQTGQLVSAHRYSPGMRIRRFVRKHRAAVAAGALLIAGLGIGGAISVRRIQAERDIADTRLVAAEDLMDFVVSDLRGRLKPLGKLELLEGVGDRVDRYYQTIDANDQLGGEAGRQELARRIEARELVGDVKFAKGDTDGALAVHRERLALAHRLGNHELIASSENSIGDVLDARGDTAGAFAAFQRALPEAIASGDPRRLGTVQMRLGGAYQEQGDLDRAVALFTAALASHERAMAAAPGDVDRQVNVAMASGRLADILEVRGEVAGALARFRAGRDRLLPVVAAHPDDVNAMRALSIFHSRIGDALHDQGDLNGALAALRQSQTLGLALAAREPFNQEWQRDIGVDHSTISHMLREQGDRKAAAAELRESHAVTDRLLAADPTSATYQRDLVDTLMDEGDLCDDPACAVARFQQALDAARALEARDPSNADVSGRRLRAQLQLAAQLHERSDPSELGAARDALAQAIAWVHATPARPEGALLVGYGKILVAQSAARTPAGKPEARALAAEALAVLRATPPTSLRSEFRGGVAEILALAAVLAGEPQPASTRIPNRRDIR